MGKEKSNIAEIISNDIRAIMPSCNPIYYSADKENSYSTEENMLFCFKICCTNNENINSQTFADLLLKTNQYQKHIERKLHIISSHTYVLLLENIDILITTSSRASVFSLEFTIKVDYTKLDNETYYSTIGEYIHKLNIYSQPDCPYDLSDLQGFASTFGIEDDDRQTLL